MDHAHRVDEIERCVVEREVDNRSLHKATVEILHLEPFTRQANSSRAEVDSRVAGTGSRELCAIGRDPTSRLKHVLATP